MTLHTKPYCWIDPSLCNPPHQVTNERVYCQLVADFVKDGWGVGQPVLIGHDWLFGRIQLVSGSHRHAAAMTVGIVVPVVVYPYEEIRSWWLSDQWQEWINNPPVVEKSLKEFS